MQNQPEKREKACSPLNDYLQRCREAHTSPDPGTAEGQVSLLGLKGRGLGGSLEPRGESSMKRAGLEAL